MLSRRFYALTGHVTLMLGQSMDIYTVDTAGKVTTEGEAKAAQRTVTQLRKRDACQQIKQTLMGTAVKTL